MIIKRLPVSDMRNEFNTWCESWIRENLQSTNWTLECEYQNFSIDFMREFKDKIDWESLMCSHVNEDLPREFIKELGFEYWEHPSGTLFIDVPDKNGKIKHITANIKLY